MCIWQLFLCLALHHRKKGVAILGHSEQGNQPNTRPSLLSNSDENNTKAVNILSGLEGSGASEPGTTSNKRKFSYLAVVVILLAGVTTAVLYSRDSSSNAANKGNPGKSYPSPSSTLSNTPASVTTAASLPVEQVATSSASATSADGLTEKSAPMAATIITETNEKLVVKNEGNPFSSMLSNEKDTASASLPASAPSVATSKKVVTSSATKTASVSDKHPSEKSAKNSSIASNEVKKEAPVKSKTNNSAESDIALISALISRDSDNRKLKPDKHTQDIVERKPGDKTKNLLARCKNLGGLEADLCRSRICSGQWANESACQAPETTSTRANSNGGSTSAEPSKESNSSENAVALATKKI
jgi:hypothetical protein